MTLFEAAVIGTLLLFAALCAVMILILTDRAEDLLDWLSRLFGSNYP